jgi:rRNA maturation RNase YbeY
MVTVKKIEVFNICQGKYVAISPLKKLAKKILIRERIQKSVTVNIILCDEAYITALNKKFAQKNYSTDVLAFLLSDQASEMDGEIYINLDRVTEQAKDYKVTFDNELTRLITHGLLHLLGYRDDTDNDKQEMRDLEDYYLTCLIHKKRY